MRWSAVDRSRLGSLSEQVGHIAPDACTGFLGLASPGASKVCAEPWHRRWLCRLAVSTGVVRPPPRRAPAVWTKAGICAALREFERRYGRRPTSTDLNHVKATARGPGSLERYGAIGLTAGAIWCHHTTFPGSARCSS
jgi:hypothetical protein